MHNGSFRQEKMKDRQDLVDQAQGLLKEYSQCHPFDTVV